MFAVVDPDDVVLTDQSAASSVLSHPHLAIIRNYEFVNILAGFEQGINR
jgi:hypothetical protein